MAINHVSRSSPRRRILKRGLLVVPFAGLVGMYLLLSASALKTNAPDTYVEYASGSHPLIVERSKVGDVITPTVRDKSLQTPGEKREKIALIISWYYVSSQVTPKPVKCYPESKCKSISWPKFEGNDGYRTVGLFDRMFSICVDLPQRITRPASTDGGPGLRLVTPYFVVKKSADSIPIEMRTIYYRGETSCSVNGGRASGPSAGESVLNANGAGNFFQCYNREANLRPGNDGNGIPVYCGLGGGGGDHGVVTVGVQGQGAKAPGGKDNDKNGPGAGQDNTPDTGSGGGGSGSTANQQDDKPNPLPSNSPQGDKDKQPDVEPSPFFDGKQYEPGSDPDGELGIVATTGKTVADNWPYILGGTVVLGAAGAGGFWRWKQRIR